MKELKIFDKVKNKGYLISLGQVIHRLEQIDTSLIDSEWEIENGAYGYGKLICSIEDDLKDGKKHLIEGEKILSVLKSEQEYFYHACIKKEGADFEMGIVDSTYLFVRSNDDKLIAELRKFFKETIIID